MKKSIILTDSSSSADRVYTSSIMNRLTGKSDFIGRYRKDTFLSDSEKLKDVSYIFSTWGMPHFESDEIRMYLPSLECIFYAAGSVQSFAREFISSGIHVFSAWGANAVPVAEYTVAQIILANKGFFSSSLLATHGESKKAKSVFSSYVGNYGAKVGIIGAGMIGKLVIQMLQSYSLDVLVFDPFLPDTYLSENYPDGHVRKATIDEIFAECNTISNHLANNDATAGMLNYSLFSSMKPNAVFINTGRGRQVVEDGLIKALTEEPMRFAILDVTLPEPPEAGSPLYEMENVILTPHIAGSSGNEVVRMAEYMLKEQEKYESGEKSNFEVTEKMLETMA